jgi:hypothetical protein
MIWDLSYCTPTNALPLFASLSHLLLSHMEVFAAATCRLVGCFDLTTDGT